MKKLLPILFIILITGCHQNSNNCPFNSVIGNYIATDQSSSFTGCYGGCASYTLVVASSGNCNSVIIKNIDVSGSNITATYLSTAANYSVFQISSQPYTYNGTAYNTSTGGSAVFQGNSLSLTFETPTGSLVSLTAIKQ